MGREGALGPGGYDADPRDGSNDRKGVKGNLLSSKNIGMAIVKDDRGLLLGNKKDEVRGKTYNKSH